MSRLRAVAIAFASFMLLIGVRAEAGIIMLQATLTHAQEPGSAPIVGRPDPYGIANFELDTIALTMKMSVTINDIDIGGVQTPGTTQDNLVNAHIHCCAPQGTNASVRWGFFGNPDNDNNPDQLVVTPFVSAVGGTFTSTWDNLEGNGAGITLTSQLPGILAGQSYINFHTVQFPGGEIRGQIFVVPEPSAVALLGIGLLGLAGLRRRRMN